MNGTQQRAHTRKTDVLAQGIADTQAAVLERFEEVEARAQQFRERLDEVRREVNGHRLILEHVAMRDRVEQLSESLAALHSTCLKTHDDLWLAINPTVYLVTQRTVWGRLRWLVRGY
jgi:dihydroorotase